VAEVNARFEELLQRWLHGFDVLLGLVRRLCHHRVRPENRHPLRLERRVG